MAFTSNEDAQAVNVLLDYYFDQPTAWTAPSDRSALDAWMQLAKSAQSKLGAGWRQVDVEKRFAPKQNPLSDFSNDPEDCAACDHMGDGCPYHQGIEQGAAYVGKAVVAMIDEPELMNGVLTDYARMQEQAEKHQAEREARRIVIDADCPNSECRFPERWFDPVQQVFGCSKCSYTSAERES